jgi:hypothetical protein
MRKSIMTRMIIQVEVEIMIETNILEVATKEEDDHNIENRHQY